MPTQQKIHIFVIIISKVYIYRCPFIFFLRQEENKKNDKNNGFILSDTSKIQNSKYILPSDGHSHGYKNIDKCSSAILYCNQKNMEKWRGGVMNSSTKSPRKYKIARSKNAAPCPWLKTKIYF
eukprot:GEMP01093077.1.p1 GENE.GEMP01093077.1~~GEMP01093077.1.p1  ORF type:complete len:123 (-),score=2.11 GEMP01093077.1:401-769(-)